MSVKLTNFVQIAINHAIKINANATRDTAVVIHYKADATSVSYKSLTEAPSFSGETAYLAGIQDYIEAFFRNAGRKLYVVTVNSIDITTPATSVVLTELRNLPMEYIMVGFVADSDNANPTAESVFRAIAQAYNNEMIAANEPIMQKIFVSEMTEAEYGNIDAAIKVENYVVKLGSQGIGASILAYYTAIDVYSYNSTQDYMFTTENYENDPTNSKYYVFDSDALVKKAIAYDMNIDTKLIDRVKNIGGNDTAGYDLTNQFMLLVIQQTLTSVVIQVLENKIRYDASGLNTILNAIVQELNRYVNNGYLSTTKVWSDPALYYEGYKVIDTNTVLNSGYKVVILPFESLTPAERAAHQLPKIYILLADSYSIRKIVINGEVF